MTQLARQRAPTLTSAVLGAVVAVALVALALRGGGYGVIEFSAFGVVIWIVVLALVAFRPDREVRLPREAWIVGAAIAALALLTGLSTLWSESAGRSFEEFTRTLAYLGVFVLVALAARGAGAARIVDGLTVAFGLVIFLAVLSRLEPALFPAQEYQRLDPESAARLTYPINYWNGLAGFISLGLPLLLHAASRPELPVRVRCAGTALLPVAGLGLYLTFSRGGAATAALACFAFLALSPRRAGALVPLVLGGLGSAVLIAVVRSHRALNDGLIETDAARSQGHEVLLVLLAVMALAAAGHALSLRLPRLPRVPLARPAAAVLGLVAVVVGVAVSANDVGARLEEFRDPIVFKEDVSSENIESRFRSGSGNGRYQYWSASVDAFESKPVAGRGSGTWELWWRRNATLGGTVKDSHSLATDVLAELGALGVIALLAVFGGTLFFGAAAYRRASGPERALVAVLLAFALTFTVDAAIDWTWEFPALTAPFFVAAAILVTRRGESPADADEARGRSIAPGLIVGLVAWGALFACAIPLISSIEVERSRSAAEDGNADGAISAARAARAVQPWSGEVLLQLAQSYELKAPDETALEYARRAVRAEPTNWETWLVLSRIEARAGQRAAAEQHFARARSLNPASSVWNQLSVDDFASG